MLAAMDLFHNRVKLNLKGTDRFTTLTGNILTLTVIAITIIQAYTTLSKIFRYQNPQVYLERSYMHDPGPLSLNSSNFVFAVAIQNLNLILNSSLLSFQMAFWKFQRFPNGTTILNITRIPMKPCEEGYFKDFPGAYESQRLFNAFCPAVEEYNIRSSYVNSEFEYIQLQVSSCVNSTNQTEITCKPKEEILQALPGKMISIQLLYSNTILTTSNHSDPVSRVLTETFWYTTPNETTITADVLFSRQDLFDDDNIWLGGWNVNVSSTYQIDAAEMRVQQSPVQFVGGPRENSPFMNQNNTDFVLLNINFKRSNYLYTTKRIYPKIQEGLASIGGIFSLCLLVFGALANAYTSRAWTLTVANELYEFDLECLRSRKNKKNHTRQEKPKTIIANSDRIDTEKTVICSEKKPDAPKQTLNEWLQKFSKHFGSKEKLEYRFSDFLIGAFCCMRRRKDKLIQNAMKMVGQELDIVVLLKRLQEGEKLKHLLLNEEQLDIFSYSRPPLVTIKAPPVEKKKPEKRRVTNLYEPKKDEERGKFRRKYLISSSSLRKGENQTLLDQETFEKVYKFANLAQSYRKLFKSHQKCPTNLKILEMLDFETHEMLYDLLQEVRQNPETAEQYYKLVALKIQEDLSQKRRRLRLEKKSKLAAGLLLSKALKARHKGRASQVAGSEETKSDRNVKEECSIALDSKPETSGNNNRLDPSSNELKQIDLESQEHLDSLTIQDIPDYNQPFSPDNLNSADNLTSPILLKQSFPSPSNSNNLNEQIVLPSIGSVKKQISTKEKGGGLLDRVPHLLRFKSSMS